MAEEEFIVLYTGQKTKKAKTWHDGTLKLLATGAKAVLYDDKKCRLDTVFVRAADVDLGEQIESDRYLILIEEKKLGNHVLVDPGQSAPVESKPCGQLDTGIRCGIAAAPARGPGGGGGLKRKRTGFVPPRMMKVPEDNQMPSSESQITHLPQADTTNLSPLQGMTSYKASIMKLYTRNTESHGQIKETPNPPSSPGTVFRNSHPGHEDRFQISANKYPGDRRLPSGQVSSVTCITTGSEDSDVSPQLTDFMSKLRKTGRGSLQASPVGGSGSREKRSPWSTFGPRKFDSESQGSQSSEDDYHILNVPLPQASSAGRNNSYNNIAGASCGDTISDTSVLNTNLKDTVTKLQPSNQNGAGIKRTTNQIMALLRNKSSKNSHSTKQQDEHNSRTDNSVSLSEQKMYMCKVPELVNQDQCKTEFPSSKEVLCGSAMDQELVSGYTNSKGNVNEVITDHTQSESTTVESISGRTNREVNADVAVTGPVYSKGNAKEEEDVSSAADPEPGESSDEQDPFEDSTFDINFSPLSHVTSSEDEAETCQNNVCTSEKYAGKGVKHGNSDCPPVSSNNDHLKSVDDFKHCDKTDLTSGIVGESVSEPCPGSKNPVQGSPISHHEDDQYLVQHNISQSMIATEMASTSLKSLSGTESEMTNSALGVGESDVNVKHEKRSEQNMCLGEEIRTISVQNICLDEPTRRENPSHMQHEADVDGKSDLQTQDVQSEAKKCTTPMRSRKCGPEAQSPGPTVSSGHHLNDLQFSPDSYDLNSSLSQLSQSGFLGTLTAASRKVNNLTSTGIAVKSGSAFDDRPSRLSGNQHKNAQLNNVLEKECTSSDTGRQVRECMGEMLRDKCISDSEENLADTASNLDQKPEEKFLASEKSVIKHPYEVCTSDKWDVQTLQSSEWEIQQDTPSESFSQTLMLCEFENQDDTASERFSQADSSEEIKYSVVSSGDSSVSAIVPVEVPEDIALQTGHHDMAADVVETDMETDLSFPMPNTPDINRHETASSGNLAQEGQVPTSPSSDDSQLNSFPTDHHPSTEREYVTSESMISVSVIPGHINRLLHSGGIESRGSSVGINKEKVTHPTLLACKESPRLPETVGEGTETEESYIPEHVFDVQGRQPRHMSVSSLPHPSRLCGENREKSVQAVDKKDTDIGQLAARHLESYTVTGMRTGSVVRRQTTQQPLLQPPGGVRVKVTAPFGKASRVTSSDVQHALDYAAHSQRELTSSQSSTHPDEDFKLKFRGFPTVHDPSKTVSKNQNIESDRNQFSRTGNNFTPSPSTPVLLSGQTTEEHWLVHDSQSSTSTVEPAPVSVRLPSFPVHLREEPVQQLQSDLLPQDDMEDNFYVDWNGGKPLFVSRPSLVEYSNKFESADNQNVPLSPCVTSVSSSPDFSPLHTVPQMKGERSEVNSGDHHWKTKLTGQHPNITSSVKQPRRPLKTRPVEERKEDGYDVFTDSTGDPYSVDQTRSFFRSSGKQSDVLHGQPVSERQIQPDRYCVEDSQTDPLGNHLSKSSLHQSRSLGHGEDKNMSESNGPRLRMPTAASDVYKNSGWVDGSQTGRKCYRYTGSARWQTSFLGQQEEKEHEQEDKKQEDSRWGRYLQEDGDDDAVSQVNWKAKHGGTVSNSDIIHAPLTGNLDTNVSKVSSRKQDIIERKMSDYQSLNSSCANFLGSVPRFDSAPVKRQIDVPAVNLNSPAFDFDDSFDADFCDIEESTKPLTHQDSYKPLEKSQNKFSHGHDLTPSLRVHQNDLPSAPQPNSPDLFPTQGKEIIPLSSKFTKPRFISTPSAQHNDSTHPQVKSQPPVPRTSGKFRTPVVTTFSNSVLQGTKRNLCAELQFPSCNEVEVNVTPARHVSIPECFPNVQTYKQVITAALKEHLNIMLFDLSKIYHSGLSKVDVAQYLGAAGNLNSSKPSKSSNPACKCGVPSKMVQVKKEGPNKGRFFYACEAPRNQQCKFFQWMDQPSSKGCSTGGGGSVSRATLCSADSITAYIRGHGITFYCECQFLFKYRDNYKTPFRKGIPAWVRQRQEENKKKHMYIRLAKRDSSSFFSRDDLWVVSQTLMFKPGTTFVARSSYFGPNSNNEVEIEPLAGYSPSNWTNNATCHAILAGNASMELACLFNLEEHVNPTSLPVLPHLLDRMSSDVRNDFHVSVNRMETKLFTPGQFVMSLAEGYVNRYTLNDDQSVALIRVATMMNKDTSSTTDPVLLIHGVFGAGKSFLLSVLIRFLVEVFEKNDSYTPDVPFPWKLLISSTTNVAVDRVLMGLLDLGFEDFIRVGSVKKIAKPVLPFSVHASGSDNQELKDLQQMLRSDIPPSEKQLVRRSIEKHRLGENKKKLGGVKVVGVTCAACSFNCLNNIHFPFVVLDECSQMTEPASMLPIARFSCEKLVLVGDPKQLDPTIQGSEAAHTEGLEQTLLDRMMKLGYSPVLLRTQYRCHPWISCIANTLFYNGQLQDGVSLETRAPLTPVFPTLCFYDVTTGEEQTDGSGSYYNVAEAQLVMLLIQGLVVEGVEAGSIGVITLYKAQMYKIITSLHTNNASLNKELKYIQVSTVDAFQGGERDVIILSCVRTNNFGFIDNDKRTNVALTRARHHLLIVGNQRNLSRNKLWSQVIQHCRDQPGDVKSSTRVTTELQQLVEEKQSQASEATSSQERGAGRGRGRKVGKRKRRRNEEEDSPPMSLSDNDTENSGQSVQIVQNLTPPDSNTDNKGDSTDANCVLQDDVLDTEDFVLSERIVNLPRENMQRTRKRQRRSHLLDPDVFLDNNQHSSDEDLPTFM